MSKMIRLGVIGVGNMGTSHVKNILKGDCTDFVVTAVADIDEARLENMKELVEGVATFTDGIELLDSGLIDACLVAVPHYSHPFYAMEAMKRGIHVMVEKPAGVFTKEVREIHEGTKYSSWYKQWVGGSWIYFSNGSRGFVMEQPHIVAARIKE